MLSSSLPSVWLFFFSYVLVLQMGLRYDLLYSSSLPKLAHCGDFAGFLQLLVLLSSCRNSRIMISLWSWQATLDAFTVRNPLFRSFRFYSLSLPKEWQKQAGEQGGTDSYTSRGWDRRSCIQSRELKHGGKKQKGKNREDVEIKKRTENQRNASKVRKKRTNERKCVQ